MNELFADLVVVAVLDLCEGAWSSLLEGREVEVGHGWILRLVVMGMRGRVMIGGLGVEVH